jgi:hypothetical protein
MKIVPLQPQGQGQPIPTIKAAFQKRSPLQLDDLKGSTTKPVVPASTKSPLDSLKKVPIMKPTSFSDVEKDPSKTQPKPQEWGNDGNWSDWGNMNWPENWNNWNNAWAQAAPWSNS